MSEPVTIDISTPGQLLTAYRRRAGLTQTELAERLGSSLKSVHNYEAGNTSPDAGTWARAAKILNIPDSDALNIWRTNYAKVC